MQQLIRPGSFRIHRQQGFPRRDRQLQGHFAQGSGGHLDHRRSEAGLYRLHGEGYAHSAENLADGELVGGLYGIRLGKVFFGESMFSKQSNASKYAFNIVCETAAVEGVELIDCQVYTEHLESLGPG